MTSSRRIKYNETKFKTKFVLLVYSYMCTTLQIYCQTQFVPLWAIAFFVPLWAIAFRKRKVHWLCGTNKITVIPKETVT